MTTISIKEIQAAFRNNELTVNQALEALSKHPIVGNKLAETLLDELLQMDAEPAPMDDSEREAAEAWESGKRGSND